MLKSAIWFRQFECLCMKWWWVILCSILLIMFYEQSAKGRKREYIYLETRLAQLQRQRALALETNRELNLQVDSQSDPEWIELILQKSLGLVPEERTKVFFEHEL